MKADIDFSSYAIIGGEPSDQVEGALRVLFPRASLQETVHIARRVPGKETCRALS